MRRFLALGCCAGHLAFSLVAGAAHVHEASDHHDGLRGLHLDHAHVGGNSTATPDRVEERLDAQHVEHHDGDARYLTITAERSIDPGPRVLPALVPIGATIDAPARLSVRGEETPDHPRGPPRRGPTPPRAPPA